MQIIPSEADEQRAYLEWLKYFHQETFNVTHHSPNEGKRSWFAGKMLKYLGMKKGYPDIAVHRPNRHYHGLFLEFKRSDQKNRKRKWAQDNWLYNLNQNGYLALYVFSAEEGIKVTTEYLNNVY